MSIQSARDFLAKLGNDEQFRQGLSCCKTEAEQQKFAHSAGFQFTSAEMKAARGELQDADLDNISGGSPTSVTCVQDILCMSEFR